MKQNKNILALVILVTVLAVTASLLIAIQSLFNLKEIDNLVNQAEDNHLEYELIITNDLTNDYYFKAK
ncbi:hypothetical protein [Macrococcus carouselicus]|uniref:Uncharacterized protein n=1 Tax=Macrococcus carouselicus TaxID=69969 RepID=A0A9Q8CKR0_9STAP|nr:hypothetical protein [Macrococcus carouselicus]TDM02394.1 hypothetical protein ERX40_07510 [Macrococcus carouselicus]